MTKIIAGAIEACSGRVAFERGEATGLSQHGTDAGGEFCAGGAQAGGDVPPVDVLSRLQNPFSNASRTAKGADDRPQTAAPVQGHNGVPDRREYTGIHNRNIDIGRAIDVAGAAKLSAELIWVKAVTESSAPHNKQGRRRQESRSCDSLSPDPKGSCVAVEDPWNAFQNGIVNYLRNCAAGSK